MWRWKFRKLSLIWWERIVRCGNWNYIFFDLISFLFLRLISVRNSNCQQRMSKKFNLFLEKLDYSNQIRCRYLLCTKKGDECNIVFIDFVVMIHNFNCKCIFSCCDRWCNYVNASQCCHTVKFFIPSIFVIINRSILGTWGRTKRRQRLTQMSISGSKAKAPNSSRNFSWIILFVCLRNKVKNHSFCNNSYEDAEQKKILAGILTFQFFFFFVFGFFKNNFVFFAATFNKLVEALTSTQDYDRDFLGTEKMISDFWILLFLTRCV